MYDTIMYGSRVAPEGGFPTAGPVQFKGTAPGGCMIIYKATNLINGKVYIGQTIKSLKTRKRQHFTNTRYKRFDNNFFANALRKYGQDSSKWEIIDTAESIEKLNIKEIYWIKFYKSTNRLFGYNTNTGGNNGSPTKEVIKRIADKQRGKFVSQETRDKLSKAHKKRLETEKHPMLGRKHSIESRLKMSKAIKGRVSTFKGHHHTAASKKLLAAAHLGTKSSKDTKRKISIALKGLQVGEKNPMCTLTTQTVIEIKTLLKEGISCNEISEITGVKLGKIHHISANHTWRHIKI